MPEGFICSVGEGNRTDSTAGLRRAYKVGGFSCAAKLTADIKAAAEQIHIFQRKSVQFTDPQSGFQQDHDIIIVVPAAFRADKLQIAFRLCSRQCRALRLIIREKI